MAAKGRQGEEGNAENSFLDDIKKIFKIFSRMFCFSNMEKW